MYEGAHLKIEQNQTPSFGRINAVNLISELAFVGINQLQG